MELKLTCKYNFDKATILCQMSCWHSTGMNSWHDLNIIM